MAAEGYERERRRAYRVIKAQVGVTALAALLCLVVWGIQAGYSAAIGGAIGTLASLYMALQVFGRVGESNPGSLMRGLYLGEALKFGLTIALFVAVLVFVRVSPLALFGAYMATFVVYWFALLDRKPDGPE